MSMQRASQSNPSPLCDFHFKREKLLTEEMLYMVSGTRIEIFGTPVECFDPAF